MRVFEEKKRDFWVTWGISEEEWRFFGLSGGFWRENAWFSFTSEIAVEEMRDFWVKWGILVAKMFALGLNWWIFEEKKRDFQVKWWIFEEKMCDFRV